MADNEPILPSPSPEQRRVAAGQFDRANQVIATGNFDYGIQLLLTCCKYDPANLIYRRALRQVQKAKHKNNLHGSRLSLLTNSAAKARLMAAKRSRDYLKVLEFGEEILVRNPWDTGTQLDMAEAADLLGLLDLAIWTVEQARQKNPKDPVVNRSLARLLEKRGNFTLASALWNLVRSVEPADEEAQRKVKDLAAHETIARNQSKRTETSEAPPEPDGDPEAETDSEPAPDSAPLDRVGQAAAPLLARIEADPTSTNAYLHLASVYRRAGQLDQAREVLQLGLGPTGNHFDLTCELVELELEPLRRDLTLAESKLKAAPKDDRLRRIQGQLLKEINSRELELFRQKADRYPTDKGHRLELGVRLLRARQLDEAIRELQAVRSDPRLQWRALMYLGFCFKARKLWRLAQRNFEEALQGVPAGEEDWRKEILFALAQGCAESGDLPSAINWGSELAHLDFGYRDIGRLLDEWQDRLSSGQGGVEQEP